MKSYFVITILCCTTFKLNHVLFSKSCADDDQLLSSLLSGQAKWLLRNSCGPKLTRSSSSHSCWLSCAQTFPPCTHGFLGNQINMGCAPHLEAHVAREPRESSRMCINPHFTAFMHGGLFFAIFFPSYFFTIALECQHLLGERKMHVFISPAKCVCMRPAIIYGVYLNTMISLRIIDV